MGLDHACYLELYAGRPVAWPGKQLDELSSLLRARGGGSARYSLRGGDAGGAHPGGVYAGNGVQASRPQTVGVGAALGPVVSERRCHRKRPRQSLTAEGMNHTVVYSQERDET